MFKRRISVASVGIDPTTEIPTESAIKTEHTILDDAKSLDCLMSAFRPLLISMSFLGLFDFWKIRDYGVQKTRSRTRLIKVYRVIIIFLLIFNFIRHFLAYGSLEFGPKVLSTLMLHAWVLLCLLYFISCFKMVENPTKVICLFKTWNTYWDLVRSEKYDSILGQACSWRQIRKYTSVCTLIGWCTVLVNIGFGGYLMYHTTGLDSFTDPFSRPHDLFPLMTVIAQIAFVYSSGSWAFTVAFIVVLCLSINHELKKFLRRMETMTQNVSILKVQENMEVLRKQHNALCNMLDTGNDVLKTLIGLSLLLQIFLIILLTYNICSYEVVRKDVVELLTHVFWLSGTVTITVTLLTACSLVNIRAHEPAKFIYNLSMKEITTEFALQVNVFLHRLNGAPIGLTASSLFVVDTQVIVSVGGILVTYLVVLLQFQQSSSTTASALANATTV